MLLSLGHRYLFYKFLGFWRDVSQSRENKCYQFQPKGDVEKAKTREITDLSLIGGRLREVQWYITVNVVRSNA